MLNVQPSPSCCVDEGLSDPAVRASVYQLLLLFTQLYILPLVAVVVIMIGWRW